MSNQQASIPPFTVNFEEQQKKQATINLGTIGHVAHGKSTLVREITGIKTQRHGDELERNITIKLGYANGKIYKCEHCDLYTSTGQLIKFEEEQKLLKQQDSTIRNFCAQDEICTACNKKLKLERHVSFVDCPGHEALMTTMLNGASVMDAVLLMVAFSKHGINSEDFELEAQTLEHLNAVECSLSNSKNNKNNMIIIQNKIDLAAPQDALNHFAQVKRRVSDFTVARNAPIIPVAAQLGINIDLVLREICNRFPKPMSINHQQHMCSDTSDSNSTSNNTFTKMIIVRSFDVNKPGTASEQLRGGVAGGSIVHGMLHVGQKIEIRPGIITRVKKTANKKNQHASTTVFKCKPIVTTITSLFADKEKLEYAIPGGLIAVGTEMDPILTMQDRLVGHVLFATSGNQSELPGIYSSITIEYVLFKKKTSAVAEQEELISSEITNKFDTGEVIAVTIGARSCSGSITRKFNKKRHQQKVRMIEIELDAPVCAELDEKISISRKVNKQWRLAGYGHINDGTPVELF